MKRMEQRVCSFCGNPIEPGTGKMFIKRDGSVYYFDRARCQSSLLEKGRLARRLKWTKHYPRGGEKAAQEALAQQAVAGEIAKAEAGAEATKKKGAKDVKVKPTQAR